jgi:hypothetical protein
VRRSWGTVTASRAATNEATALMELLREGCPLINPDQA